MEVENIYPVTEPVGSEQDAPVSNMEMLSDVFFKEEARRLKEAFCFERHVSNMKVRYLSTQLMDGVLLLSQNGRLINDLLMFFDRQLKDIQRLREEKCEEMENVRL